MRSYPKQAFIINSVVLSLVLQACVPNPSYAPVTTNSQIISEDQQNTPDVKVIEKASTPEPSNSPSTIINTPEPIPYPNPVDSIDEKQSLSKEPSASNPILMPEQHNYHTVKKGETLFSIGVNSGLGYQQLVKLNKISPPYTVEVGQRINLVTNTPSYVYKNNLAKHKQKTETVHKKTKKTVISVAYIKSPHSKTTIQKTQHFAEFVKYPPLKAASISFDNKKMLKLAFKWPLKGAVVKNFRQSKNKGIDIAGKIGQTVYAAEAGKVIYGGSWLAGFGNLLIIKHNSIYLSAYANNSHLLVKEGQTVSKGQVVAQVGRTLSQKAALHFEIRKNGKSVNPLRLLPRL